MPALASQASLSRPSPSPEAGSNPGSSRVGGARPKALVHDAEGAWLAKFPSRSRDGLFDIVGLEATCLQLARRAGLRVPDARLQSLGRRRVLLVRRFDVTEQGGRHHMISMRTLCKERPGIYVTSYSDLAVAVRKYSASPAEDIAALFRHMAFNAAIGNVDDHLKNFWMLHLPSGYRLAPAFDLVPDVAERGQHTLSFRYDLRCPARAVLLAIAKEWRVAGAQDSVDEVVQAVRQFRVVARKLGVRTGKGLDLISADVRRRVELLAR
ncbi:MAG: type II toxin-antitoxin system HipA family toxin [Steroidobacteraceae bacterium]